MKREKENVISLFLSIFSGVERSEYVDHVWNVHRWIVAYENNEEDAAQVSIYLQIF